jgi:hypothetical protein
MGKPVFGEAAGKMEAISKIKKWLSFSKAKRARINKFDHD